MNRVKNLMVVNEKKMCRILDNRDRSMMQEECRNLEEIGKMNAISF